MSSERSSVRAEVLMLISQRSSSAMYRVSVTRGVHSLSAGRVQGMHNGWREQRTAPGRAATRSFEHGQAVRERGNTNHHDI